MFRILFAVTLLQLPMLISTAQQTIEVIRKCGVGATPQGPLTYTAQTFPADIQSLFLDNLLITHLDSIGSRLDFRVSKSVRFCESGLDRNQRLYVAVNLNDFTNISSSMGRAYMAHELGHFANQHFVGDYTISTSSELNADEYGGWLCGLDRKSFPDINELRSAYNSLDSDAVHPHHDERFERVKKGFDDARRLLGLAPDRVADKPLAEAIDVLATVNWVGKNIFNKRPYRVYLNIVSTSTYWTRQRIISAVDTVKYTFDNTFKRPIVYLTKDGILISNSNIFWVFISDSQLQ